MLSTGTLLTILWDSDGSHYSNFTHKIGLSIYSNSSLIYSQSTLSAVNVSLADSKISIDQLAANSEAYTNILANPNAPWGLPNISADYVFNADGRTYDAYKLLDGLLWYDSIPDNYWTNNQSTTPFNTLNITLPRARNMSSISLAVRDDTKAGGVIACPAAVQVTDRGGTKLLSRAPWTDCQPNALNTLTFDVGESTSDFLSITLTNQLYLSVSLTEIQVWVPSNPGPEYYAADALLGTFIGGFQGRSSGLNSTVFNGGVALGPESWIEWADVRTATPGSQSRNVSFVGSGNGSLLVQMNYLKNETLTLTGDTPAVELDFLAGKNVMTIYWASGDPVLEYVVVE